MADEGQRFTIQKDHCGPWCCHSWPPFTNCMWQRGWKTPHYSLMATL